MQQSPQHIVARNTIVLLAAQIITRIAGFITAILLTNYLDVDAFGRYNFLLAYATLFTPLCDLGIDVFIIRELSIHPERQGVAVGTAFILKSGLFFLNILVVTASFYFFFGTTSLLPLVFLVSILLSLRTAAGTFSGLFRAHQQLTLDSLLQISAKLFDLVAVIVALLLKAELFLLFQVLIVSSFFQLVYAFTIARRHSYLESCSIDRTYALSLLKGGLPFVLTSISVMIYFQIDAVMLSTLVGEHETGIYRSATNLVFSLGAFSAAVVIALFPMIAQKYNTNREEAVKVASNAMFYSLLIAVPIAVGTTVLADPLIRFLYKSSYAEASVSLRILAWWIPVSFATNIFGHILGAIGLQRKVLLISILNAVFNVAANCYFIPKFGAVGASIITVATEIIGLVFLTFVVTKHFGFVYQVGRLLKIVIASLILIPLIGLSRSIHVGILIGFGIILYIMALFILRALAKKDLEQLKAIIYPNRFHHIDK
jgi:O-antigen/teichoic acid export membrane protein